MYKHKYLKYKSKYLSLKKELDLDQEGGSGCIKEKGKSFTSIAPRNVERQKEFIDMDNMVSDVEPKTPTYLLDRQDPDSVSIMSSTEEEIDSEQDTDVDTETIKPDTEVEDDLGAHDIVRIKKVKRFDISENQLKTFDDETDTDKILYLKTLDNFDDFTELYGFVRDKTLFIKWSEVSKNHRGLFIEEGLAEQRKNEAFYEQETYRSWWLIEYNLDADEVAIFIPQETDMQPQGISMTDPFEGTMFEEYQMIEKDFIDISKGPKPSKVVRLADHMDFDTFTNSYGILVEQNVSGENHSAIDIDWESVATDYQGFYVDKDYNMEGRDKMAFFKDDKHTSWLKFTGVKKGTVYIFE